MNEVRRLHQPSREIHLSTRCPDPGHAHFHPTMQTTLDTGLRIPARIYLFKALHPLLRRTGRYLLLAKQSRRFFLMPGDYVSSYTAQFGLFEAEEVEISRRLCEVLFGTGKLSASTMIDVGAHIGTCCTALGASFGRIVAVDAVEAFVHVVRANLRWNGLQGKARVLHRAVSDHEGHADIVVERFANLGHSRIAVASDPAVPHPETCERVPVTTIDTIVREQACAFPVSFIKIDIEGHEVAALRGALDVLAQHRPLVQCEIDRGNLQAVKACLAALPLPYDAWQVVRGSPGRHILGRIRDVLLGGQPVVLNRLEVEDNPAHMPCVLLIPREHVPKLAGAFAETMRVGAHVPAKFLHSH